MKATLGIDIAKQKHQALLLAGDKQRPKVVQNNPDGFAGLVTWIEKQRRKLGFSDLHICMEATGIYFEPMAQYLHEAGYCVSVVNPARIANFAKSKLQRGKTDEADAALIALFCQEQTPQPWEPAPAHVKQLQTLTRHLEVLKQTRHDQQNRLEAARSEPVRASLEALIKALNEQIAHMEQAIEALLNEHPDLKQGQVLLCSIPGLAWLSAVTLLAEVPPRLWASSARKVAAFAGLTPKPFRSGETVRRATHICKTGSARLRRLLYMPALSAMRYNPVLKRFAEGLLSRGKARKAVVCAVMRKLLHQAFGVLKHGKPFDPNWKQEATTTA